MNTYYYHFDQMDLWITYSDNKIMRIDFEPQPNSIDGSKKDIVYQQLSQYFNGELHVFDLDLDLIGTDFQKKVWNALINIPYGQTKSYQDIADEIGMPKASRAIGNAIGKNPIPIIVPCHRVIRKDGSLGGFSGGLDKKVILQEVERIG